MKAVESELACHVVDRAQDSGLNVPGEIVELPRRLLVPLANTHPRPDRGDDSGA
jgi:hypothetical protein